MSYDFNDAEKQSSGRGEPIPDGTVAPVVFSLIGIKHSERSGATGLDVEYTVTQGPYAKRKAFAWVGIEGAEGNDGHMKMVSISRAFLRGVLESAYGIDPADDSADAMNARRISSWDDFNGVEFLARFGVEKGKDFEDKRTGEMKTGTDKNVVRAVTPDDPDYEGFKPAKKKPGGTKKVAASTSAKPGGASVNGSAKPSWAS
jgi:hypothetical protein